MLIREIPPATDIGARARLASLIEARNEDLAGLSRMIDRPAGYLSRYVREGRPKRLREAEQQTLARYFDVRPEELGAPAQEVKMEVDERVAVREQLELQIGAIMRDCPAPKVEVPPPAPEPVLVEMGREAIADVEPFGRWLLAQKDRGDWIDALAAGARKDPRFPKNGSPDDVRRYMSAQGVGDPDVFEQIDDAERHWLSL